MTESEAFRALQRARAKRDRVTTAHTKARGKLDAKYAQRITEADAEFAAAKELWETFQ